MHNEFQRWFRRYLSDPEAVVLLLLLLISLGVVVGLGQILAPVLAALVFAYVMQGMVSALERWKLSHSASVLIVFSGFMALMVVAFFGLIPVIWRQVNQLISAIPNMAHEGQLLLNELPKLYPEMISHEQVAALVAGINQHLASAGQWILSASLSQIASILTLLVYLILVPLLVFFFLKDRDELLAWVSRLLPDRRRMIRQVGAEMNLQIANYIRGKCFEILIVGAVSYVFFFILDLNYALLLATLIGFSVVVPYVGATLVTLPVALVGFFQWGWTDTFFILMIGYGIIQALDGNVLVPLLFREAVNLHPVAIVVAILVFGGFWGVWGVFFAIPLATLLKAVMDAWPDDLDEKSS